MGVTPLVKSSPEDLIENQMRSLIRLRSMNGSNVDSINGALVEYFDACETNSPWKLKDIGHHLSGFRDALSELHKTAGELDTKFMILSDPGKTFDANLLKCLLEKLDALINELDVLLLIQEVADRPVRYEPI